MAYQKTEWIPNETVVSAENLNKNSLSITTALEKAEQAFQQANNGKASIADAIGTPATSSDTFTTLANYIDTSREKIATKFGVGNPTDSLVTIANTRVDELRETLANNLSAKGKPSTADETMSTLVNKVSTIESPKKVHSGTVTLSKDSEITVSGLGFRPGYIFADWDFKGGSYREMIRAAYSKSSPHFTNAPATVGYEMSANLDPTAYGPYGSTYWTITDDGFIYKNTKVGSRLVTGTVVNYIAIEE